MDYTIKRSVRAKKMRLKMSADGALILVLPKYTPEIAGRIFVESNRHWIKAQRIKLPPIIKSYQQSEINNGTPVLFFDQNLYTIKVEPTTFKRDYFESEEAQLILYLGNNTKSETKQIRLKILLEKLYRETAREYLTQRVDYWCEQMGLSYKDIRIKNTKTRWGSCSSHKNLNFNWRIMMAPKSVIDYLVVHEVAHLKHMNHSAQFWDLVKAYDPKFKHHKKWLRDNQERLLVFLKN